MILIIDYLQRRQIDWKFLRAFTTTLIPKGLRGSRLIDEPDGKNVKDWIISSQAPKLVMIEHGEGSESR